MTVADTAVVRDKFGLNRIFYRTDAQVADSSIKNLFRSGSPPLTLDPVGLRNYLLNGHSDTHTCFAQIKMVPPNHKLTFENGKNVIKPVDAKISSAPNNIERLLLSCLDQYFNLCSSDYMPALALSGGLDSAVLLALLSRLKNWCGQAFVLSCNLQNDNQGFYNETEEALVTAALCGVKPTVINVDDADFITALPAAVAAAEAPFYNMHPVSKYLLAHALGRNKIQSCITGDGADQLFAGGGGEDYFHIVGAIFGALNVDLQCPFLDQSIFSVISSIDCDKSELRKLAMALGVGENITRAKKHPRLAPAMALDQYFDFIAFDKLANVAQIPLPLLKDDDEIVKWVTTTLLIKAFMVDI